MDDSTLIKVVSEILQKFSIQRKLLRKNIILPIITLKLHKKCQLRTRKM